MSCSHLQEPKLFNGLTFYFGGDFESSYKGDLQSLVIAGGGNVLQRKPISRDRERLLNECFASTTFIIYSLEPPEKCDSSKKDLILDHRRAEAHTLANATGAKVAARSWILDSIAACKLQKLTWWWYYTVCRTLYSYDSLYEFSVTNLRLSLVSWPISLNHMYIKERFLLGFGKFNNE